MRKHGTTARWLGVILAAPLIVAMSHALGEKAAGAILPASELEWMPETADLPQRIVTLWGDRKTGEAAVLIKVPPGWQAGHHAHTADYDAVVIAGTWIHTIPGAAGAALPPGSYWRQPKEQMHDDQCEEGSECIVFVHTDQAIDLIFGASKER